MSTPKTPRLFLWLVLALICGGYASFVMLEAHYEVPISSGSFRFERPWAALLLVAGLLVWIARGWLYRSAVPRLQFSQGQALAALKPSGRMRFRGLPTALRTAAIFLLAVGLVGPQSIHARDTSELSGIEIILSLDMSRSMEAADIRPSRFEATKSVVADFIKRRPSDRIGAVVFGRDAYTLMPLTIDRRALRGVLRDLELDQIDARGTAIGNAVGVSLNRLRRSQAKSKVIILLTDGESNSGNITPLQAAELAEAMQVKIFPILMGVSDNAPVRTGKGLFGGTIWGRANYPVNPELLRSIAQQTGGEFFGVNDREGLEESFHSILDALEKSEIEDAGRVYTDLYPAFVWPALVLLLIELLIANVLLRRWP